MKAGASSMEEDIHDEEYIYPDNEYWILEQKCYDEIVDRLYELIAEISYNHE